MVGRRALCCTVSTLAVILVGTVIVLSTVVSYFGVDTRDVITEGEMSQFESWAAESLAVYSNQSERGDDISVEGGGAPWDDGQGEAGGGELGDEGRDGSTPTQRIPKIVHQTWKEATLPERWEKVRQNCMELHPDYEYKLWTDASSRAFIASHYDWFLPTFDGYPYSIQRADAIRYFVLHRYGGIYMDLDVGCRRSMDPLLYNEVVLPATIPVGVSNDLMLAEPGHPFLDLIIHNLMAFDHQYGTNYPTVMFSTGPMFLSAQYGLWPKDDEAGSQDVRILPRRWYGKNAPAEEMEDSFFEHYYGSSWHADDAGFITFLGKFGLLLMYCGATVVVVGMLRLIWIKQARKDPNSTRPYGPVMLPFHFGTSDILPFTHAPTPSHSRAGSRSGSRPGSPPGGSGSGTPMMGNSRHRQDDSKIKQYLPDWLAASSSEKVGSPQASWSQYLPSAIIYSRSNNHKYLPTASTPSTPPLSEKTLHDGVAHSNFTPNTPLSPDPPAYTTLTSTLQNWGTSVFRSSSSSSSRPPLSHSSSHHHLSSAQPPPSTTTSSRTTSPLLGEPPRQRGNSVSIADEGGDVFGHSGKTSSASSADSDGRDLDDGEYEGGRIVSRRRIPRNV